MVDKFTKDNVKTGASGQVSRVARRFGIVAAAGELASLYGLTGWQDGEATAGCAKCFNAWLESFGGIGNKEELAACESVRAFLSAHGESRFQNADGGNGQNERAVINRAGFYRMNKDGEREYLVFPSVFRREMCKGVDYRVAGKILAAKGWIDAGNDRIQKMERAKANGGAATRFYVFTSRVFEDDL
jgi:uncharacterized protein (DUF927 family)